MLCMRLFAFCQYLVCLFTLLMSFFKTNLSWTVSVLFFFCVCEYRAVKSVEVFSTSHRSWRAWLTRVIVSRSLWCWYVVRLLSQNPLSNWHISIELYTFCFLSGLWFADHLLDCILLGRLGIIDHDVVELNNMHRQVRDLRKFFSGSSFFSWALSMIREMNKSSLCLLLSLLICLSSRLYTRKHLLVIPKWNLLLLLVARKFKLPGD